MKYVEAKAFELDWLVDFYNKCGYGGKVDEQDHVVFALDGDTPIGIGRLSEEQGIVVLRGMQVLDAYRRQGVGKILSHFPRIAKCIFSDLLDFNSLI